MYWTECLISWLTFLNFGSVGSLASEVRPTLTMLRNSSSLNSSVRPSISPSLERQLSTTSSATCRRDEHNRSLVNKESYYGRHLPQGWKLQHLTTADVTNSSFPSSSSPLNSQNVKIYYTPRWSGSLITPLVGPNVTAKIMCIFKQVSQTTHPFANIVPPSSSHNWLNQFCHYMNCINNIN